MSEHKILLVEDARDVQLVVFAILKQKYQLKSVTTAAEALKELESHTYSLIILDVELPDGDGFQICAQIKMMEKNRHTPIIFLTGKRNTSDKVMGLSLGADDYIVKPLDPMEFHARVEARIRRLEQTQHSQENAFIGPFKVVASQQKIYVTAESQESLLDLASMEFKLLYFLLRHEDQILSREQILDVVWGQLANVTDRTVDTHIYNIRRKLGPYAKSIQSVPRVGYRYSQNETQAVA